ncbi:amidase [Dongia sp.]|uniref:amidase n=1 Tax=Dongia sp. TaxID=1977262 RepID=UPI0035B2A608
MPDDLAFLTATELVALYRARKLSPVEATRAALDGIDRHNSSLNSYCFVDQDGALAAARESEARWHRGAQLGLIDGVPVSVKDLVLSKGMPTLRGSRLIDATQEWNVDAPSSARLREHGGIILGKTTTPEFGWKGVTDSPLTGITRNPWNPSLTPGGSSGGAAVAAATGMGALHIGTDGGGSIRIPASFTGIVGFKATFGRVPAFPLSPFGSLANVGPMTRTVADAALMFSVISRPDPRDWYALPVEPADFHETLNGNIAGWRIAYAPSLAGEAVDPEVGACVAKAALVFEALGAKVEQVDHVLEASLATFQAHWFAGAAFLVNQFPADKQALLDPGLAAIVDMGRRISLMEHMAAVKAREAMGTAMNQFHQRFDLLLTPTMPIPAFAAGLDFPDQDRHRQWSDWTPFTYPFNLTRQPAISVPCGLTAAGLPIGLQIIGPLYGDRAVLNAARAFEQGRPFQRPNLSKA